VSKREDESFIVYKARDDRSITSRIIFPEFSAPANNVVSQLIYVVGNFTCHIYIYIRKFLISSLNISVIVIFYIVFELQNLLSTTICFNVIGL